MKNKSFFKDKKNIREPLTLTSINEQSGLTQEQVRERLDKGHANNVKVSASKTGWQIIAGNVLNVFNILCFTICIWLLTVCASIGDLKDCLFIAIISANILIGIYQEFRAKKIIDKMSLTACPKTQVLREGSKQVLSADKLVRDDIILLSSGEEIPADSVVLEGEVYVNESMLTGETNSVKKVKGDTLFSGSFIVSGYCRARVTAIAEENYIQSLAKEAKQFKTAKSVLMNNLYTLLKVLAIIVICFSVPAFLNNYNAQLVLQLENYGVNTYSNGFWNAIFNFSEVSATLNSLDAGAMYAAYKMAVRTTVVVLEGMIPSGMMLLTSVTLAVGVIKIAKHKAMVQGLYSIETLARVNLMCLDKTGTLTDGTMSVKNFEILNKDFTQEKLFGIISKMEKTLEDNNATALALKNYFIANSEDIVKKHYNFDSDKKYSKVEFEKLGTFYVGAPEFICDLNGTAQDKLKQYQQDGFRVLLVAYNKNNTENKQDICPLAFIIVEDNIKPTAKQTIEYFKKNKVGLRVISGDNPITVSHIAKIVGIEGYENYVSAHDLTDEELLEKAKTAVVFGRVNPHQKKLLIKFYKKQGNTVAMTGDGINDILALKEADCAIAMANGADATKSVAHIVLMDSDFASMPHIVLEGRRVINNVERTSTIFLTKTLTMFLFQVLYIILQQAIPITPINLAFVNLLSVGIPTFFVALEENTKQLKGNFFANILRKIIPCAFTIFGSILTLTLLYNNGILNITHGQFATLIMIAMYTVFTILLAYVCWPLNIKKGILVGSNILIGVLYFTVLCNFFEDHGLLNIFSLSNVMNSNCLIVISCIIGGSLILLGLFKIILKLLDKFVIKNPDFKQQKHS